jgi:hypothetical protein
MIHDQSKGSLLVDAVWGRHQTPFSVRGIKEKSPLLDNDTCGVEVPQDLPSLDLDGYGSDDGINRITTFVLLGWGAGLLAFLAYVFTMKGEIFQNNSWETYQVAAQVVCTLLDTNKPC